MVYAEHVVHQVAEGKIAVPVADVGEGYVRHQPEISYAHHVGRRVAFGIEHLGLNFHAGRDSNMKKSNHAAAFTQGGATIPHAVITAVDQHTIYVEPALAIFLGAEEGIHTIAYPGQHGGACTGIGENRLRPYGLLGAADDKDCIVFGHAAGVVILDRLELRTIGKMTEQIGNVGPVDDAFVKLLRCAVVKYQRLFPSCRRCGNRKQQQKQEDQHFSGHCSRISAKRSVLAQVFLRRSITSSMNARATTTTQSWQ